MTIHSSLIPAAAVVLLAAACSKPAPSAPTTTPPTPVLGFLSGKVDGKTMSATYTPLNGSDFLPAAGGLSPAIYGTSATVGVTGSFISMVDVPGVSRTWKFRVRLRNLEAFPIGSNYATTPGSDSSGVFAFFTLPPIVSKPAGCACTVKVTNSMGTRFFNAAGQQFFWYNSRPAAFTGGLAGNDTTTNNPIWTFVATPFSGADTAHAFIFALMVSAAWPPTQETTWQTTYDATTDTLPDVNASPPWTKFKATGAGGTTFGTETNGGGTELDLAAGALTQSIYFSRHDSLGQNSAFMDVRMHVVKNAIGTPIQAVIGFVEPTGHKQVFLGIGSSQLEYVSFSQATGQWTSIGPTLVHDNRSGYHIFRLRKIGTTLVEVCIDGVAQAALNQLYGSLEATQPDFANASAVFGTPGRAGSGADSRWTSVSFTIGSDGGGC